LTNGPDALSSFRIYGTSFCIPADNLRVNLLFRQNDEIKTSRQKHELFRIIHIERSSRVGCCHFSIQLLSFLFLNILFFLGHMQQFRQLFVMLYRISLNTFQYFLIRRRPIQTNTVFAIDAFGKGGSQNPGLFQCLMQSGSSS
jgi:hypothetical protein